MPEKSFASVFWSQCIAFAPPIMLAILGGAVRQLRKQGCNLQRLLIGGLTAAFTGAVVHCGLAGVEMEPLLKASIVGLSGYTGGDLLAILARRLCSAAGKFSG